MSSNIYTYLTQDLYAIPPKDLAGAPAAVAQAASASSSGGSYGETQADSLSSGEIDGQISFVGGFIQSKNYVASVSGWRLSSDGTLNAINAVLSGSITATAGAIGGWVINATNITSGSVTISSSLEQILMGSATAPTVGTGIFIGKSGGVYQFRVGNPASAYMSWSGSSLVLVGGVVQSLGTGSDLSLLNWTFTGLFTSAGATNVAWSAGTLTFHNGATYTISAGTTGTMTLTTYIYIDSAISSTVLQITTTASNAIGVNKVLIAVAGPNSDAAKAAIFQVFNGTGGMNPFLTADNIAAGTITANEIAANTITADELSATLVYAGTITLSSLGHIKAGQTDFDTGSGFFLGSSAGAYKFSIGDSTGQKMTWNGSRLYIKGDFELSSVLNMITYTVATLPVPPSTAGFNSPSANE